MKMGKFARSWALVKASASVLRSDRELLLLPLLSGIAALIVTASFLLPVFFVGGVDQMAAQADQHNGIQIGWYVLLFAFYLVQYTVIFFFNTALVGAAMQRLEGGHPTLRDALALAWSKLPQILGYAAIAATVGMVLRALEERMGLIGRLVIGLIGVAWSVATFLVVPILAATNTGPVDAVKHSAGLLKRSWGENIIGNAGMGFVFGLINVVVILVVGALVAASVTSGAIAVGVVLGAIGVLALVFSVLIQSALQGIYAAAVYRYAEHGEVGGVFDGALISEAFRPKKKR
jgi:hypothetical protein